MKQEGEEAKKVTYWRASYVLYLLLMGLCLLGSESWQQLRNGIAALSLSMAVGIIVTELIYGRRTDESKTKAP